VHALVTAKSRRLRERKRATLDAIVHKQAKAGTHTLRGSCNSGSVSHPVVEGLASSVGLIKISRSSPTHQFGRQNSQKETRLEQRALATVIFSGRRAGHRTRSRDRITRVNIFSANPLVIPRGLH
jgi:hypothetical protein